ncbi:MAG TPA: anthranilate phosphoribosyltransferase [Verrucomicrobiae bacterium]|jgi:anthranilate phosphoribosyltransferase|nr:anthranilate phosphoribosyltransferase [Verrucomicrobiae bacterium]
MLRALIKQLKDNESLTDSQVAGAIDELAGGDVAVEPKADFLTALARKGETVGEIAAFARELRGRAIEPPIDAATRALQILDVCGAGGDRLNTFNISTTVAIIAAADGVPVAKHGNRAVTSQAGSADVLQALGVKIDLPAETAARALREQHFAFFFAPDYHPAFKEIGPARRLCGERGQKTIFNYLGPLLNPARPALQLIGVPHPRLCLPIATVLQSLEVRRGMVVSGAVPTGGDETRNLDELSTLGENTVVEFHHPCALAASSLFPENFPIQPAALSDLAGGDRETNAEIVRRVLRGEERGPKRDSVLLNAAAALFVAEKSRSLAEGWERAAEVIDSGRAFAKLEALIAFR